MTSISTIAFYNIYEELNRDNRLFESNDAAIGDDLLLPFVELRQHAKIHGVNVATLNFLPPDAIDAYIFIDMPDMSNAAFRQAVTSTRPIYLLVLESPLVRPQNYNATNYDCFRKIFTYDDSLVDDRKFFKINYSFNMPGHLPKDMARKTKLCVTIAGNKASCHPQELYSQRLAAIRWFERNHPGDFDLFGVGWDRFSSRHIPQLARLNRIDWLKKLLAPSFPSWRGPIHRKRDIMGAYRFAFCYENICDVPGYITEKIFDAFFAGTVPLYRGANNIEVHIPADCFIDLRNFTNISDLYDHLAGMSDERYMRYLDAIESFLGSEKVRPFTCDCFSETLLTEILCDK